MGKRTAQVSLRDSLGNTIGRLTKIEGDLGTAFEGVAIEGVENSGASYVIDGQLATIEVAHSDGEVETYLGMLLDFDTDDGEAHERLRFRGEFRTHSVSIYVP